MTPTYDSLRAQWIRSSGQESLGMRSLIKFMDDPELPVNTTPDYQRGRVWTDDQCARYIGFLAEGGDSPYLWMQRWPYASMKPDELIDGLQRLTAVRRFVNGDVPMELTDGKRVYLRDMTEKDQRMILSTSAGPTLTIRYVQFEDRADVLRFYLRLNRGGTPHTDAEIERVRELLKAQEGSPLTRA